MAVPSVIVVIISWNSGKLLAECMKHLMVQTIQPVQVLIIDNVSSSAPPCGMGGWRTFCPQLLFLRNPPEPEKRNL